VGTAKPRSDQSQSDVLAELLEGRRGVQVAAIGRDGIIVEMPDGLVSDGCLEIRGRSGVDLVIPSDRLAVIDAWQQARAVGQASVVVHLVAAPLRKVVAHFLDVTASHGVFVGIFVDEGVDGLVLAASEQAGSSTPRLAQIRKDGQAVVILVDEAITLILGWSRAELIGRRTLELIHPDDHPLAIDNWLEMLAAPGPGRRIRLRHRHRDGRWVWLEITNHNLLADPAGGYVLADMVDITEEMAAHEAVRAREQLLDRLAEALPMGLLQIDTAGAVIYTNERLHQIVGTGRTGTLDAQLEAVITSDRQSLAGAVDAVLRYGANRDLELQLQPGAPYGLRRCAVTMRPLTDRHGEVTGAIICLEDITARVQMHDELQHRATFDDLTGCSNRATTMAALAKSLQEPINVGTGIVFVDLDRFKQVNDQLGHAAGDRLLVAVVERLEAAVRDGDVVGRIGGDEFLVVCGGTAQPGAVTAVADRIVDSLSAPVNVGATTIELSASIGVAWTDTDPDPDRLVARADLCMYHSKSHGRGRPVLAVPDPLRGNDEDPAHRFRSTCDDPLCSWRDGALLESGALRHARASSPG
jgi:diguanylate cyclase (GGDEF)-like protein/PAS domain S-box-containing protein